MNKIPNPNNMGLFFVILPTYINLRVIKVSNAFLRDTGIVFLMAGLIAISTLKSIDLSYNYIGLEDINAIVNFFKSNRLISGLTFCANYLIMKEFHKPGDVQQALLEGLATIPALISLASIYMYMCIYLSYI
jgi:Ran GTPase-activating protein (RanGAP) involved in mRNA processing and transport